MNLNIPLLKYDHNSTFNIKLYILDPLSVIIKLAILANKPIGTKIDIKNNVISFQDPGLLQFAYRYISNSNKTDLHFLYNPIHIACSFFLTEKNTNTEITQQIKKLFETAQVGLKNLIETYRNYSMIIVCLNYYYSMISNYVDRTNNDNLFQKDAMTSLYTEDVNEKLMKLWSDDRIKIILDLIDFLSKYKSPLHNVKSLENIMDDIDIETQIIVSNI
jgi:hypothetical protein